MKTQETFIAHRRKQMRMTQREAAAFAEISPAYWAQLEAQTYGFSPSIAVRQRVARVLGIEDYADFFAAPTHEDQS